ncbi:MAG: hypothetical protein Kapaf2KO_06690 [Candidatus Kapaibacteriales bacterium]
MKKLLLTFALPFLAIFMTSCDSDDDNPTGSGGSAEAELYMPLAVGNYWVYETKYYDEAGNEYSGDDEEFMTSMDTIRVEEMLTYQGKQAYKIYDSEDDDEESSYFTIENGNLYIWFGLDEDDDEMSEMLPVDFSERWVMFLGPNGGMETILNIDTSYTETIENVPVTVNMKFILDVEFEDNGDYTFDGMTAESRASILNSDIDFSFAGFGGEAEKTSQRTIFMKGIGVVESELGESTELDFMTGDETSWFGKQILVEYKLN